MVRMKSIRNLPFLVAAVAILAVLAGCGGGGDDSSSTVAGGGKEGGGATTDKAGTTAQGKAGGSSGKSGKSGSSAGKSGSSSGKSGGSSGKGGTPLANGGSSSDKPGASSGSGGKTSGETSTPSGGLSKAEFVKQANAICEQGKKQSLAKMAAYVKKQKGGSGQPNPALLVKAVKAVFLPGVETQIDEIRALGAPPGDEAKVEAFLAALEEGVNAADEGSGSPNAAFGQSFKRSAKLAREYGLDGCAYG